MRVTIQYYCCLFCYSEVLITLAKEPNGDHVLISRKHTFCMSFSFLVSKVLQVPLMFSCSSPGNNHFLKNLWLLLLKNKYSRNQKIWLLVALMAMGISLLLILLSKEELGNVCMYTNLDDLSIIYSFNICISMYHS